MVNFDQFWLAKLAKMTNFGPILAKIGCCCVGFASETDARLRCERAQGKAILACSLRSRKNEVRLGFGPDRLRGHFS